MYCPLDFGSYFIFRAEGKAEAIQAFGKVDIMLHNGGIMPAFVIIWDTLACIERKNRSKVLEQWHWLKAITPTFYLKLNRDILESSLP